MDYKGLISPSFSFVKKIKNIMYNACNVCMYLHVHSHYIVYSISTIHKYIPPFCATRDSLFQLASDCFRIMELPKDAMASLKFIGTGSDCGVFGEYG